MIGYVLIFVGSFFALLGLAELFHGIRLYYLSPKKHAETYSVIFLDNICPEQQIKYSIEQLLWFGKSYADKIVAVCSSDLDKENLSICREIAKSYGVIILQEEKAELKRLFKDCNDEDI